MCKVNGSTLHGGDAGVEMVDSSVISHILSLNYVTFHVTLWEWRCDKCQQIVVNQKMSMTIFKEEGGLGRMLDIQLQHLGGTLMEHC